jgi:hypothetical protein
MMQIRTKIQTRQLADQFQCEGNRVVWMHPTDWWRKVEDAVKTGYPPNVLLLEDIRNGRTALQYDAETCVALYRNWAAAYPTLRIIWRYWCNMGCSVGYIDDTGDHCWNEEAAGKWVAATTDKQLKP